MEQFPRPLMGPSVRKHGGLIIHIIIAIFTFLGLAIVCDNYFVASLERICEGKSCVILKGVPLGRTDVKWERDGNIKRRMFGDVYFGFDSSGFDKYNFKKVNNLTSY